MKIIDAKSGHVIGKNIWAATSYKFECCLHQIVKDADGNYRDLKIFAHFKSSN